MIFQISLYTMIFNYFLDGLSALQAKFKVSFIVVQLDWWNWFSAGGGSINTPQYNQNTQSFLLCSSDNILHVKAVVSSE